MSVYRVSIASDNGLAPNRRHSIILTNAGLFSIAPLGTNLSKISMKLWIFFIQVNAFGNVVCQNRRHFVQGRWISNACMAFSSCCPVADKSSDDIRGLKISFIIQVLLAGNFLYGVILNFLTRIYLYTRIYILWSRFLSGHSIIFYVIFSHKNR